MFSRPWGVIPQPNASWLGELGCKKPLDGYLFIMGQVIPWPKNDSKAFAVVDYEQVSFLRLKADARSRCMTEWNLKRKADIIAMLREWDDIMQNHTPSQ